MVRGSWSGGLLEMGGELVGDLVASPGCKACTVALGDLTITVAGHTPACRRRPYSLSFREELDHRVGPSELRKGCTFELWLGPSTAGHDHLKGGAIFRGIAHPSASIAYARKKRSVIVGEQRLTKEIKNEAQNRPKVYSKCTQIPHHVSPKL